MPKCGEVSRFEINQKIPESHIRISLTKYNLIFYLDTAHLSNYSAQKDHAMPRMTVPYSALPDSTHAMLEARARKKGFKDLQDWANFENMSRAALASREMSAGKPRQSRGASAMGSLGKALSGAGDWIYGPGALLKKDAGAVSAALGKATKGR
jgi:hypothetical protein